MNAQIRFGLVGSLGFLGLAAVLLNDARGWADESLPLDEVRMFTEVFGKIKSEYVEPVDDATLLTDAVKGMLAGLDPHSAFLDPLEFEQLKRVAEPKYGGLGLEVIHENGLLKVITPIDGTPAQAANIAPGDIILMLDGMPVRGMALTEVVARLRGEPGTKIVLTLSRARRAGSFAVTLKRALIQPSGIRGQLLDGGFGYVRIASFQISTAKNLRSKIIELQEANGVALNGLLLDLRNNPGGILTAAVATSDMFLTAGDIVSTRGRNANTEQVFTARPDDIIADAPMVVLVNGGSASAAEIVAGALQDHRRAVIIGTQTFGKGSVQTVIPMQNGGALKLTTALYYTPAARSIQARGIAPDVLAEQVRADQPTTDHLLSEADLTGHLKNDDQNQPNPTAPPPLTAHDPQLREALNLLKAMSLTRARLQLYTEDPY